MVSVSIKMIFLCLMLTSCTSSEFTSSSAKKTNYENKKRDSQDASKDSPGFIDNDLGNNNDEVLCKKETLKLNLVIIFDRSGSQSFVDMQNMRDGSIQFLSNISNLKNQGHNLEARASIINFSRNSEIGKNRWQTITESHGLNLINEDILEATDDRGGSTRYDLALESASELFRGFGSDYSDPTVRNYVVFLSDGNPDRKGSVINNATNLVMTHGAALITIGVGIDDETYLRQMANLKPNTTADHVGKFIYADKNPSAIGRAFDGTERIIKDLCI